MVFIECMLGDGKVNGTINTKDYGEVSICIFEAGYKNCDHDLNGVVNVLDYGMLSSN